MKLEREIQHCVRCGRGLRAPGGINVTGDPALAVYQEIVTVGARPRLRSKKTRNVFCFPCGAAVALSPDPNTGAFNSAIYQMLYDLYEQSPVIGEIARVQKLNPSAKLKPMPGSSLDRTLEGPVLRIPVLQAS